MMDVVVDEDCPLDLSLAVNLGTIFKLPPNLKKIGLEQWIYEFDLPQGYIYKLLAS